MDSEPSGESLQELIETAAAGGQATGFMLAEGIDRCPIPVLVLDREHRIAHWNKALESLSGLPAGEMTGSRDQWRAFYPQQRPTLADLILDDAIDAQIDTYYHGKYRKSGLIEGAFEAEDFFPALGGDGRWLFFTAALLRNTAGEVIGAIETLQDVTARRRSEAALLESRRFLTQVVDGSSVPTFVIDRSHRVTHWNRACEALTGTAACTMIGSRAQWRPFYATERPLMADLIVDRANETAIRAHYAEKCRPSALIEGAFEAENFFPHFGDTGRWLYFTAAPLYGADGAVIGAIETLQDISERKRAEQALRESEERYRRLSITDALTGLFNSRHFYAQIESECGRALRYRHPLALLLLDADNFKLLNDRHGHLEGDQALQTLARVIQSSLRDADSAYRYGGEEFSVLLPETGLDAAAQLAERLRERFAATPLRLATGQIIHCSVSIGVAEYRAGESMRDLIQRADAGVYHAKHLGRNRVVRMSDD